MITLQNICAGYGRETVLENVNLEFSQGKMTAVLGPNGSGKTTLVSVVSGLLSPARGSVLVDSRPVSFYSRKELARLMAVIPQRVEPSFDMSVRHMVLMGRYAHSGWLSGYSADDFRICAEALEMTSISGLAERSVKGLSGGEFQRVLIARAVAQRAPMMLLDEAASGIDVSGKIEIFNLLRSLEQFGTGIVSVIHDLNLAALYFDRLIFLREGRVVLDGAPSEVITEENIAYVYDAAVRVVEHPELGLPQVLFNPAAGAC